MPRKYELVDANNAHTIGHTFYRVKALRDFGDVHAGDVGGWIEDDTCLSQDGSAWVYGNARVYDGACVYGNARVYDGACVYGSARVYGNACVYDDAEVYGNAEVHEFAEVYGSANIAEHAQGEQP